MHPVIREKLAGLRARYQELNALLADPQITKDPENVRRYRREHAQLTRIVDSFGEFERLTRERLDLEEFASDPEMAQWVEEELPRNADALEKAEKCLARLMLPRDPLDAADCFLEIRAGTGGDEAALFAGDLFRMYGKYAQARGWRCTVLSQNGGEHGGYKELICRICGEQVYSTLKFESGAHRVQRIPETESGGRIHTSAATVAVLPEAGEIERIEIRPTDLRIDTFRASGAGGQHINKTDSAIRITHLPSGVVVECQEERSQHKNRARAMRLLHARLLDAERRNAAREIAAERKSLVGSGDRSERIRTYNFPQNRVTDHRIDLTLYGLSELLAGQIDPVITALQQAQEADALLALEQTP